MTKENMTLRIDPELKQIFFETCKERCIVPTQEIRRFMFEFVQEKKIEKSQLKNSTGQ